MTKKVNLSCISEQDLLNLKISDLPIKIENTWLEGCIQRLYAELDSKGLKFRPNCYLADEWLTPDNEPVIGLAFFLAHPVLTRLERKVMLEAEGDTKQWCMMLLRHEAGHAINYAYKLYRRKKWQKTFGPFSSEYADTYRFRPYSKSFVRHLEDYYAQYHPDEDFAETFAVWLNPGINWQKQYKGWKALGKLNYVQELMSEIKDKEPKLKDGKKYWNLSSLRITLKNYYKKKKQSWAEYFPDFHDANLKKIFSQRTEEDKTSGLASDLVRRYRKSILSNVSAWAGEKKYIINDLLDTLIERCRDLKLVVADPEPLAILKVSTYITTLIMNYLYTGRFQKKKK